MLERVQDNPAPKDKTPLQMAEGVYLVRGARRGAICDTNTDNVYSVNESAVEVLTGKREDQEYTSQLQQMGLLSNEPIQPAEIQKQSPKLNFVWFEIVSDDCNESCSFCYADSMPPSHRKALGLEENREVHKDPRPKLTFTDWCKLIKEAYDLGCRQCQFIGGEPFVYLDRTTDQPKRVLDLATYAKDIGYEFIEIFTNGTLVTKEDIENIKGLGINLAVSLHSSDPETQDSITRLPGSHKLTVKNLKRIKDAEIPTRVASVLTRQNQHTVEKTMIFIEDIGFEPSYPDVLRPKGRGDNPEIQPDDENLVRYGLILGPNFTASKTQFEHYYSSHSCLAGKITITDRGDVLPCIFSRDQVVGNIREQGSLQSVIEGERIKDTWKTTKDDVLVCQDCEYRYVCFDCRPLSQGASNGNGDYKTAPYPRCTYNPYKGEWGGGTWKLDENGHPYYDESLKPIIEKIRTEGTSGNQAKGH